jgi:hypothetical protein
MRRDPSLLAAQFGLTCAVALVVGGIFFKLTKDLEVGVGVGVGVAHAGGVSLVAWRRLVLWGRWELGSLCVCA